MRVADSEVEALKLSEVADAGFVSLPAVLKDVGLPDLALPEAVLQRLGDLGRAVGDGVNALIPLPRNQI